MTVINLIDLIASVIPKAIFIALSTVGTACAIFLMISLCFLLFTAMRSGWSSF